jgi:hypothetical protein
MQFKLTNNAYSILEAYKDNMDDLSDALGIFVSPRPFHPDSQSNRAPTVDGLVHRLGDLLLRHLQVLGHAIYPALLCLDGIPPPHNRGAQGLEYAPHLLS